MGAIAGDELGRWERVQESGVGPVGGCGGGEERILVSVRLRPLNEKEIYNRNPCDWECINDTTIVFKNSLPERSILPTAYTFDKVFHFDCPTRQVYEEGAKEVVLSVVSGINSSIFAYGQTSSGKTYTMSGITEYSVADIYDYIQKHEEREFALKFSAMEIYNEAVRDLLSADSTPLRLLDDPERGTIVEKLTEETLRDWNHLKDLLAICEAQRQIGETSLNETSSRSHQILRLTIENSPREFLNKDNSSTLTATVNFVDLAGSERACQAMSAGARLKEGCHINRSLLTLGTVIRKLSKGRNGHIPYRDSKLTRILQPSLGGNARTAIICTMSPAHSHVEQSRNTLLFASCAKEVSTNAQVNVIMSDKALVKHLQRELARLENELRYPGSAIAQSETLIMKKDVQIRKMEKEIKELIHQRDLAQSRLEDLLHTVKDDQSTRQLDFCQFSPYHLSNASKDEDILSESSSISFQPPGFSARRINTSQHSPNHNAISNACYITYSEKPNCQASVATQTTVSSPTFIGLLQHDGEDITSDNTEEFEDLCKEVRCIEMDETSLSRSGPLVAAEDDSFQPPPVNSNSDGNRTFAPNLNEESDLSNHYTKERVCTPEEQIEQVTRTTELSPKERVCTQEEQLEQVTKTKELSPEERVCTLEQQLERVTMTKELSPEERVCTLEQQLEQVTKTGELSPKERVSTLEQQLEHVRRTKEFSSKMFCAEPSPWMSMASNFPSSKSFVLSRSRSCRATIVQSPASPWFFDEVQNERTPPNMSVKDFPGRPEGVHKRAFTLKYGAENAPSSEQCLHSEMMTSADVLRDQMIKTNSEEDITRICNFVAGMKEMVQIQYQKQHAHGQTVDEKCNGGHAIKKSVKDAGVDPINSMESPSGWMFEFEKQQQEIIELWHECNVSLVHRTYFFLLFRGESTDSIYMEVELRRLSFLKATFSKGDAGHRTKVGDVIASMPASSLKPLRREREMLCRRMNKKLATEERESLYRKWGIALDSKNRRVQLSRLLWSKTGDMEHIRESASIVAKLIGLLEPGLALREMFELSFTPQATTRGKSSSWRYGLPSLL